MPREKEYRTRVSKTLNFEMNVYEEFQELCKKEEMSVSKKLQEIMKLELQKNAIGSRNPIGVTYVSHVDHAEKVLQSEPGLEYYFKKIDNTDNIRQVGSIQGYHNKIITHCKIKINQLKTKGEGYGE